MRPLLVLVILVGALSTARADISKPKCKDPAHYIYTQTSGCIKRPQARQKTPAESYVNGLDAVGTDPKRAFTLFESACTAKYAAACLQLGLLYQSGRGRAVAKDKDKAHALFEQGCELGDGVACQKRGSSALDTHEPKEARVWFDKGCAKSDGVSCGYLALMLDQGYGGDKDPTEAKAKYEKAHKLLACPGSGMACYMRAYFLEAGLGVKADPAAAFAAYRQACAESLGDGCQRVAKLIDRDKGDPKDALDAYVKACELESADSCSTAARRLSEQDAKATYPLELAERACELNSHECGTLSWMYRTGHGTKPDQVRATEIQKNACDAGDHFICVIYAQRLRDGIGVPGGKKDQAGAEKILEGACKGNEETACTQLAQWVMDAKTDDARAFRFADRGCTLKSPRGCFLAGWMTRHDRRGSGGLGGDAKKAALALDETGCELGSANACDEAGELYAEAGDPTKALARFKTGCAATEDQAGAPCVSLVIWLATGKAGTKDLKGAHAAAVRLCPLDETHCPWVGTTTEDAADIELTKTELGPACARGEHAICYAIGLSLAKGTIDDKRRAREMFATACKAKHMTSCNAEADAYRSGVGGPAEPAKATAMFQQYCDEQRDAEACFQAAYDTRDLDGKVTLDYADKGCTLGHAEACNIAGFTNYTARKPVAWDITAAFRYYTKACDLGSATACGNLGEVYRYGLGAPPDPKKARELYQKSCEAMASQYGCAGYAHYLATGDGGAKQDTKQAETLWRTSCEAESVEACAELALLLQREHGAAQEISRLQLRAFSLAEKQAPTNPEYMYWLGVFYRDGVATMKQPKKAEELFGKACDSFDPFGCIAAGKALLAKNTAADREQAHVYFQRACAAGVEDGCVGLKAAEGPTASAVAPPQQVHVKSGCGCHGEVAPGGETGLALLVMGVAVGLRRRRATAPRPT